MRFIAAAITIILSHLLLTQSSFAQQPNPFGAQAPLVPAKKERQKSIPAVQFE